MPVVSFSDGRASELTVLRNSYSNPLLRLMLAIGLVDVATYKSLKQKIVVTSPSQEVVDVEIKA